ncbi:MAG: hypothetical protein D6780_03165, partial [Candidatus Dadabacteria bacterium]
MHVHYPKIDTEGIIKEGPLKANSKLSRLFILCVVIGVVVFFGALFSSYPNKLLWGAYYTNFLFWMGLSLGMLMAAPIVQIVRAKWSPPIRRIAEAPSAFLPWLFLAFLATWFGRKELFPWARGPMPGREWWMREGFVYWRFSILFLILFYLFYRFVRLSLRSDIAVCRERAKDKWQGLSYVRLVKDWKGEGEIVEIQRKLSWNAPLLVVVYCIVITLFATEMVVGMDTVWYSNMFGGFEFLGNIYMGWASIALIGSYVAARHSKFGEAFGRRQLWDLGMLTFGFCMLWAYTFFAQFLAQWYGNMPEETQWLIVRTREFPWKGLSWVCFSFCFIIPFVVLLSEDVKKSPLAYVPTYLMVIVGIWLERYIIVMPQLSPGVIPFSIVEVGIFLGFLGVFGLCVQKFLSTYPIVPVSHPL